MQEGIGGEVSRLLTDVEAKKVVDDYIAGDWATRIITTGRGHWEYLVEPLCQAQANLTRTETLKECGKWLRQKFDTYEIITIYHVPHELELLKQGKAPWEVP